MDWYLREANQGLLQAQYNIGGLYDYSLGVPRNFHPCQRLVSQGSRSELSTRPNLDRRPLHQRSGRVAELLPHHGLFSQDPSAQNWIGCLYQLGNDVPQDSVKAMYWYEKTVIQGYAEAQNNIGYMYHSVHNVSKGYSRAMDWYRKAANQGLVAAQHTTGWLYGVSKDEARAMEWYKTTAEGGNDDSKKTA